MDVARKPGLSLPGRLLRLFFPPRCQLCGRPGLNQHDLCAACGHTMPWMGESCMQCALPLPAGTEAGARCGRCLSAPPVYDRSISLMRYENEAVGLITRLKFSHRLPHARLLSRLLAEKVRSVDISLPQALLPVPLHSSRLRQRGFNQSVELSRELAKQFGLPLLLHHVERVIATESQTGFDRAERLRNMRGAFHVNGVSGYAHVAVIDDVVTTGSTVNELARTLKRAGVERVDVWSVARAV